LVVNHPAAAEEAAEVRTLEEAEAYESSWLW
jgi:hypothetical protein